LQRPVMPLRALAQLLHHVVGCILDGEIDGYGSGSPPTWRLL
jgi:hypothetical protein